MINNSDRRLIIHTYSAASVEATKINIQGIANIMALTLQSRLIFYILFLVDNISNRNIPKKRLVNVCIQLYLL